MKQSKRLLCVLLAMVLMLSCLTVGVSAYKTDYTEPAGYSSINEPYFSCDQAATAVLDYLDDILAEVDMNETYVGITIRIQSIDTTFTSLKDIFESTLYKIGKIFDLGDIEDLDVSIPKNGNIRRTNGDLSDTAMLGYVLQFVQSNADPLYKVADNTLDLGLIENFWDMQEEVPILNDLHGYINEIVYKAIINSDGLTDSGETFVGSSTTLDAILQDFINNRCVKFICDMTASDDGSNTIADFLGLQTNEDGTLTENMGLLGLCPSLKASDISLTTTSMYDFIENLFSALIDDVVVKFAGSLILDALDIDENDPSADTSYINIAITLFVTAADLGLAEDAGEDEIIEKFLEGQGVENPASPKPIDKTNATLKYILSDGLTKYIYFVDDGNGGKYLHLDDELVAKFSEYIKMFLPMLGSLVSDFPSLTTDQTTALNNMNDEQTFAFLVKYLLESLVDGVDFADDCDTIKELVTYTLVNVCKDIVPNVDFEAKIKSGEIDPDSDDCLDVAAVLGRYYLNGEFGMQIPENVTFVELLNYAFDFFLDKYSKLFNVYPDSTAKATYSNNVWYKAYRSAFDWIPLQNLFYGVDNSWSGVQDLFMNKIINNVLDFDINGLFSIIGERPASSNPELAKPFSKLVANLLARVLNTVFQLSTETDSDKTSNAAQLALIIPYSYSTLDQITKNINSTSDANNGTGLKNTVKMLLTNITNITGTDSLVSTSLDLIAELIGIIDLDEFSYAKVQFKKNTSGLTYSISSLKELYNSLKVSDNLGVKYYEDDYQYFSMVDYAPWAYLDFKGALKDAASVIETYDNAKSGVGEYPTKTEITYAYYQLDLLNSVLLDNKTTSSTYQLQKVYNDVIAMHIENTDDTTYSVRSWKNYTNAINFVNLVLSEFGTYGSSNYKQSRINMARKQLIAAVDGLKAYTGIADYDKLNTTIDNVLSMSNPDIYTESSLNKVIEAYQEAYYLDKDYGSDEQNIVNSAYKKLTEAINELKKQTCIDTESIFDDTIHIDEQHRYVFGLGEDFYSEEMQESYETFDEYFTTEIASAVLSENLSDLYPIFEITSSSQGSGTGAKIQICVPNDDGSTRVVKEYTNIVFGDVTGDGSIDGTDAVIMKTYAALMLDQEFSAQYIITAGDLNFDGNISGTDVNAIVNYGVGKGDEIDQCPENIKNSDRLFADVLA